MRDIDNPATTVAFHVRDHQPGTTNRPHQFEIQIIVPCFIAHGLKETVELLPGNSRSELALTICEHLNWRSAKGTLARTACLRMLERLEKLDILTLPPKRLNMQRIIPKPVEDRGPETDPAPPVIADIRERAPIALEAVSGRHRAALWNGFVARYHYLVLARKPPRNQFSSTLSAWVLRGIRNIGCQIAALEVDFKLNFGPETGRSGQISRFGDDSTHLAPGACGQS